MSLWQSFARAYFDAVYNPLYDSSTARLSRYVDSQKEMAARLRVEGRHRVLCVGLGTGNELTSLRARAPELDIVGVDISLAGLTRARRKPAGEGQGTAFALTDSQQLAFRDASFDRVLCYHVTDFVPAPATATAEMMRVLRPGGRFVISFPARREGLGLGLGLLAHGLHNGSSNCSHADRLRGVTALLLGGLIYLPLMLRPKSDIFTPGEIGLLLRPLGARECIVESDPVYRDHLVTGVKRTGG